jgi:putative protein-disulfide isomerase
MPVRARYYTDPACAASWAAEPALRALMVEFGPDLSFEYVMGGLAREYGEPPVMGWLAASDQSGMPVDPLLWRDGPIGSSYPACMAVKAAAEQGPDAAGRYLRALREGLFCFRRKLDTTEALVEEARGVGLDVERFRIDLASNAVVEAFAADLDAARSAPEAQLPSLMLGDSHWVHGRQPYERYREAALAAVATPSAERPGVADALARFDRMAAVEVAAVCDIPLPRAQSELWELAMQWRARPVPVLAGHLWEAA